MKDFDEMRNIDVELEKKPSKKPRKEKKGGFWGKFLCVFLGLVIGLIAGIGGLGFFGWYVVAKMPIDKATGKIGKIIGTDIDYTQYISPAYGEKTIANLVGDTISAVDSVAKGEGTLNSLNAISPLVGKLVCGEDGTGGLVATFSGLSIPVDGTQLMNRLLVKPAGTPDSDENKNVYFGDYIFSCFNEAPLGDFLSSLGYATNDMIKTLCYGEQNVDYIYDENGAIQMINGAEKLTIGGFLGEDLNDKILGLPIDAFLTDIEFPTDVLMCTLAYGPEYRYEKELDLDGNVIMKQVFYEYVETAGGFILQDDEGNDVTANIVEGEPTQPITLTHIVKQTEEETITQTRYLLYSATDNKYYSFDDAEYSDITYFKKNTVGDLSNSESLIEKMYVKDLLKVDETDERVMIALCYGTEGSDWKFNDDGKIEMLNGKKPRTVKELKDGNLFNTLTLKDLLGEDVEMNMILHSLANKTIEELPSAMNELTFDDIFPDHIYEFEKDGNGDYVLDGNGNKIPLYETGENGQQVQKVSAMWNYLFDNPNTTHQERPNEYYLLGHDINHPGVDQMIENMRENMQTATLEKLVRDDLVHFSDDPTTPENEAEADKDLFLNDDTQKQLLVNGELKYVREMTIIEMISWAINS